MISKPKVARHYLASRLHEAQKSSLQPIYRAYALGLASSTLPRIISICIAVARGQLALRHAAAKVLEDTRRQIGFNRFPATCALLAFASTWLPQASMRLVAALMSKQGLLIARPASLRAILTLLLTFAAGIVSFSMLNRRPSKEEQFGVKQQLGGSNNDVHEIAAIGHHNTIEDIKHLDSSPRSKLGGLNTQRVSLAGRSMDLTIFAACRASDICLITAWRSFQATSTSTPRGRQISQILEAIATPALFATSSAIVMWSWVYSPHNLPTSYNAWVSSAAQIDPNLIQALRECRFGTFVYGEDTGRGRLLEDMSRNLGYPTEWGDPEKTIPIPCELYHSGAGPSCEWHAITRFARGWAFAMRMYLPLNLLIILRRKSTSRNLTDAVLSASRSSTFLGAFVALFYYGVCCGRTRIGGKMMPKTTASAQWLENGPSLSLGCLLCGWSILLEKAARQLEIAFFVAPRAVATVFPRRYNRQYIWREQVAFAASVAIILTTIQEKPQNVRGVFGRVLSKVVS